MGLQFLFMDDNVPCHRTVAAEQLLEREDIEHASAARTLPPVTIRGSFDYTRRVGSKCPQQLIDTPHSQHGQTL
ncbi:hypothetical protein TNCV_3378311 [Trichonephila clavipes]|nr:hypothetical protein TNCV_3378311 [Trichonephila clavipes]